MTKREKISRAKSSRELVVVAAISFVTVGALVAACGLDDTVIDEQSGSGGGGTDATVGVDGTILPVPDGATRLPDGDVIFVDAGPDGTPHTVADAADPDDADLSDATVTDSGCAPGSYACTTGGNTYCLGDCSICNGLHSACERTHTCVDSCADCADKTECIRSGFTGNQQHCVQDGNHCSLIGGNRVFCGQIPFFYIDCPGSDQVCVSNSCLTCGEGSTMNDKCSPSSNGKCQNPGPTCQ